LHFLLRAWTKGTARVKRLWFNWAHEQMDHGQPLQVGSFLWQFWESTLENWQSEFL
jgi:hypothetical protein